MQEKKKETKLDSSNAASYAAALPQKVFQQGEKVKYYGCFPETPPSLPSHINRVVDEFVAIFGRQDKGRYRKTQRG